MANSIGNLLAAAVIVAALNFATVLVMHGHPWFGFLMIYVACSVRYKD